MNTTVVKQCGLSNKCLFSGSNRPYNSYGNGAAMRVSPVAYAFSYPKFPIAADVLEKGVEYIASRMMEELHQNRIVVEYPAHTVMLEENADIDPKINLK